MAVIMALAGVFLTFMHFLPEYIKTKHMVSADTAYRTDLEDISQHYMNEEDSRFWVATVFDNVADKEVVVGTLALKKMNWADVEKGKLDIGRNRKVGEL